MILEEKLNDFLTNKANFFHNGRYNDKIHSVYQDLMCIGLSSQNMEEDLKIILRDLLEIEVRQRTGNFFTDLMRLEAQYVAQINVN